MDRDGAGRVLLTRRVPPCEGVIAESGPAGLNERSAPASRVQPQTCSKRDTGTTNSVA
jgi:hypothetical protein